MTRTILTLAILTHLAPAQVKPEDLAAARKTLTALAKTQATASQMSADYRQERTTVLLRKPLISRGSLVLRQDPPCLIFRNAGTDAAVIRLTRKLYEVHRPMLRTLERTRLPTSTLADALFQSFRPRPTEMEKTFRIKTVKRDKDAISIEYEPRNKKVHRFLRSFSITIGVKTSLLQRVAYTDPQGDRVTLILDALNLDPKLDKHTFDFATPPGTRVLTNKPPRAKARSKIR